MTTLSDRRLASFNGRRPAITLIEIMSSILVLSIGLVGVLAAIPFGGLRMAQMSEADNFALLAKDAAHTVISLGWANPNNWFLSSTSTNSNLPIFQDNNGNLRLNLTCPFFIDPLTNEYATDYNFVLDGSTITYTRVSPRFADKSNYYGTGDLKARYERAFYLPDDFAYGATYRVENDVYVMEDDSSYRPRITNEEDEVLKSVFTQKYGSAPAYELPSFTGRYTWMASVYPKSNTEPFYDCSISDVSSADYDVVVFKDRILYDEKKVNVTIDGVGLMGGSITIDLDSMLGRNDQNDRSLWSSTDLGEDDKSRLVEQLEKTRYLMLMGDEDITSRQFARWYKIANYSVVDKDGNGYPSKIRASVIGPNFPSTWNNANVVGLIFPGVVGVCSGTTTF